MRTQLLLAMAMSCGLAGCGSAFHGPPTRVVSTTTRTDHLQYDGAGGLNRVVVADSRLIDENGRQWTETATVAIEPVPGGLAEIEAELFEQAQLAAQNAE